MFLKILLIAFLFAGSTGSANAAPVIAAAAAFASTWFGSLVVQLVVGLAVSYVIGLIQRARKTQDQEEEKRVGMQLTVQAGDDQPIGFPVGACAVAGTRKYLGSWGFDGETPNAYLVDVIQISDIPVPGISGLWVDDAKVTILWAEAGEFGAPIAEYRANGRDYMWVKFRTGDDVTADPYLTSRLTGEHPWTPDMIGRGCAAAIITCLVNDELFSRQPAFVFEPMPTRWYDLRKDSTNGGNGTHRWDNRATWEPTLNPIVIIYNLIRGVYYGDEWIYGGQNIAAYRLPSSSWMAAANECDVLIPLDGGGYEPQFRCGTEIMCDSEPLSTIEKLLVSCSGRMAEVGGRFEVLVGAPAASVYAFSDQDIVTTKGQNYAPYPNLSATHNAIEATYPEPAEKWGMKDAPSRYNPDLEALDGDRQLPTPITFDVVPFGTQVQRLMKAMLLEERRFAIHQIPMPPSAYILTPNSVVSWTSARNGYVNKKFLVTRVEGEPGMIQILVIKEIDPSDYSWSSDEELPIYLELITPSPVGPQPIRDWEVVPWVLTDASNVARRPAIKLSWDGTQPDVAAVAFEVRLKSSAEVVYRNRTDNVAAESIIISQNILNNQIYEVHGRYIPGSPRPTSWSEWVEVLTPDIRLSADDVNIDLSNVAKDVMAQLGAKPRQLIESFKRLGTLLEQADREIYLKRVGLERELSVEVDNVRAGYKEAITAAVGPGSAVASQFEELYVQMDELEGSFTTIIETALGPGGVISQALESLYAAMGGNTAEVNVRWTATAAPSGYSARYAIQAAVNDGTFRAATLFLDVPANPAQPTRIGLMAGQTAFFTSAGVPIGLMDENGFFRSSNGAITINMFTGDLVSVGNFSWG